MIVDFVVKRTNLQRLLAWMWANCPILLCVPCSLSTKIEPHQDFHLVIRVSFFFFFFFSFFLWRDVV
ncbi:hypothetical protein EV426DRAFT_221591 [Tirmania nivea]|nr:hypothetical protein EV426DRAFT_221591 [Tirmania nivea]